MAHRLPNLRADEVADILRDWLAEHPEMFPERDGDNDWAGFYEIEEQEKERLQDVWDSEPCGM